MDFLKLFLRGIGLLPGLIVGVEGLFGGGSGVVKRQAALDVVTALIDVVDAVSQKQIVDGPAFTDGLGKVIDGVVACLNASLWFKPKA